MSAAEVCQRWEQYADMLDGIACDHDRRASKARGARRVARARIANETRRRAAEARKVAAKVGGFQ